MVYNIKNGGGGNCTRVPFDATSDGSCGYEMRPEGWPEHGRECEALRELVANWHCLTPSVRHVIMELVRSSQRADRPHGGVAMGDAPRD